MAIIGSGPAGYTAGLYCARAALDVVVVAGRSSGGALMTTTEIENFPGVGVDLTGPDLMRAMRAQAEHFGAEVDEVDAIRLDLQDEIKTVVTDSGEIRAKVVLLCMGSSYRRLGVPGEDRLSGAGVSWCATCDGFFFRDRDIVVVGGGDTAMEEALFLTRFGRSVTVVHRRSAFRASRIMLERAQADPKIEWVLDSEVVEVCGRDAVEAVRLRNVVTGTESTRAAGGVFVAIGHDPRSELVRGQVPLDDEGYVVVSAPTTATAIPGVFAAGDLVDARYRQAVTAAGSGCAAALDACRSLDGGRKASLLNVG